MSLKTSPYAIEPIHWETEDALSDNSAVMCDYIDNINMLDITLMDGTYAEGINSRGIKYAIHASGNGDFFNHKVEFELLSEG